MKQSMYLSEYLETNASRGVGNGVTISTFLNGKLHGKAKKYGGHYAQALRRSLDQSVATGLAVLGKSVQGAEAWYPSQPTGGEQ